MRVWPSSCGPDRHRRERQPCLRRCSRSGPARRAGRPARARPRRSSSRSSRTCWSRSTRGRARRAVVYPAAAIPPTSASASPTSARPDRSGSAPVARATPSTAIPMPAQVLPGTRMPRTTAISEVQTGVVQTSATDIATLVSFALGTHVPKCTARQTPDRTLAPSDLRAELVAAHGERDRGERGDAERVAPEGDRQRRRGRVRDHRRRRRDRDDRDGQGEDRGQYRSGAYVELSFCENCLGSDTGPPQWQ